MPIFEYVCRDCGTKFEKIVTSQGEEVACKECASHRVDQQLSAFAVSGAAASGPGFESGPCACGAPRRGMCGE
jgi:putative FmdB family regulatory protein